jgi:hypothetical protein
LTEAGNSVIITARVSKGSWRLVVDWLTRTVELSAAGGEPHDAAIIRANGTKDAALSMPTGIRRWGGATSCDH